MSASMLARVLAAAGVAVAIAAPSDLLPASPADGWELASRDPGTEPNDLTFDEYAELEPDSVAHLDPTSDETEGIVATVDVWSRDDEFLVIEIVRSPDEGIATSFVDQAAAKAIAAGMSTADPPFDGAWSYSGPVGDTWTRIVSWSHGRYAVTLTHLTVAESDGAVIDRLASTQAALVVDVTGEPAGDAPVPEDPSPTPSDGGIPIVTVLLWLVGIAAAVWIGVRLVRWVRRVRTARREPRDVDDIISEARRSRRPAREDTSGVDDIIERARRRRTPSPPEESIDDVIERARREARADVERAAHPERSLDDDR